MSDVAVQNIVAPGSGTPSTSPTDPAEIAYLDALEGPDGPTGVAAAQALAKATGIPIPIPVPQQPIPPDVAQALAQIPGNATAVPLDAAIAALSTKAPSTGSSDLSLYGISGPALPAPTVVATTPTQVAVVNDYQTLLNRTPSQADLNFWSNLAARRGEAAVARALSHSPEYRTLHTVAAGTPLTTTATTTTGSTTTRAAATRVAGTATTTATPAAVTAASPQASKLAYVDALYLDVLGAAPDPAGASFWVDQLDRGVARRAVAHAFALASARA